MKKQIGSWFLVLGSWFLVLEKYPSVNFSVMDFFGTSWKSRFSLRSLDFVQTGLPFEREKK
ncbi:MAG TPA: hypothetical protein PL157_21205 [Acidobacteriota bacterium]|nr:hypothetical protein [Acidobacteriota bacterium]